MIDVHEDSAKVGFPPPLVSLGFLLLGLGADTIFAIPELPLADTPRYVAGGGLALAGLVVGLSANMLFNRSDIDVKPWHATAKLTFDGAFRFTRNPMYLGMTLLYAGLAILFLSVCTLALLPVLLVVIQTQVIAREEHYLESKFGQDYLAYKRRVRRWF